MNWIRRKSMKRFKICLTDGCPDGRRAKTKSEPSPGSEARSEYWQSQMSGRAKTANEVRAAIYKSMRRWQTGLLRRSVVLKSDAREKRCFPEQGHWARHCLARRVRPIPPLAMTYHKLSLQPQPTHFKTGRTFL